MKLYSYWRSSSSYRVRIALAFKGLAYEYVPINIHPQASEQWSPSFDVVNPLRQVPVLEIDAGSGRPPQRLTQSMAILEYLEEIFPSPPLLPADPWQRARVRQLAEVVNAGIQPLQNLAVQRHVTDALSGDGAAFSRHFVTLGLHTLERMARESAGRFVVGDAVSFADVYLVPQLYAVPHTIDIVRSVRHRFLAAGDNHLFVTCLYRLCCEHHGLEA